MTRGFKVFTTACGNSYIKELLSVSNILVRLFGSNWSTLPNCEMSAYFSIFPEPSDSITLSKYFAVKSISHVSLTPISAKNAFAKVIVFPWWSVMSLDTPSL